MSNCTIPGNADAPLLVVRLPESGATLIGLLSFIFPLSPTLPPTSAMEETMELLSTAQKYEMNSVLPHIRLYLAQQDSPFICKDNAFPKAAQLPLKAVLTFRDLDRKLEGKLDIMPTYLHGLWTFHEIFRTCVKTDLQGFRKSSASSMVKGLKCISRTSSGIPSWLDYIISTAIYPFLRDFVEFQKAWVQHVKGSTGRPRCVGISSEVVRAVWKDIDTIVRSSLEKAGSSLAILGGETHSRTHICSPTTFHFPNAWT
ncbi:hypothetical protein EDB83DRAFT_1361146 [Lactarius deliciosus]|nr:hypothetical protein EDB83DRAFT_1361146 [Lactarius deliciosus]